MIVMSLPQIRQNLERRLSSAQSKLQLVVLESQQAQLVDYLLELEKWNKTYNLTAVRDLDDMLVQHVFDCLAIMPAIDAYETQNQLRFNAIADIGSGAGLPAVILAILRPESQVVSIDAVEKKTAFVQNIANKLGLVNLQARHERVEKIKDLKVDLVISRAFAALPKFVSLSKNLVSPTGVMAVMKSKKLESEIHEFSRDKHDWHLHQTNDLDVPDMQAKRYLVWLRRNNND